ncbi:MAG: acyl-[acyl-carrier-protein]--UDP-N-acetylglucosamine O-acyltransferase [Legionellales bacterium RIFCSPHIGHO2_12_FULL_37_14]|nr:MAG: acyl-[acyl-carrier-protein]--UDP-N-acetylglucosamine O-acyltransferase [Legionellales bacterium RIFCSPHIGHO2_12_FULL_37_14]
MISEHAIIDSSAIISANVSIGPWAFIGPNVVIGEGTIIGPHVVIENNTTIGKNNQIFQFSSVGTAPQDVNYKGEPTKLEIGDNNVIREYSTVSRGSAKNGLGTTKIGNNNYLMAYTHIGHDCVLGNHIIMVNYSGLSGHVTVHDAANIGAYAGVHQFCHIGASSFIGRATYISKDVLPYLMISGYDAATCGINVVGLRRRGFSAEAIDIIRKAYKIIFRSGFVVAQALDELLQLVPSCNELTPMIEMLRATERGIVR